MIQTTATVVSKQKIKEKQTTLFHTGGKRYEMHKLRNRVD